MGWQCPNTVSDRVRSAFPAQSSARESDGRGFVWSRYARIPLPKLVYVSNLGSIVAFARF
jgi:hypothetical protein